MSSPDNSLSKVVESVHDIESFVKQDQFLERVNIEPPKSIVKDHPMAKGVKYIPIDKIELMLTKIFQHWHIEVLREGQLLNSIYVTIRLHYKHPISSEWQYQDGVGAAPIQTDKGKTASDLAAIKNDAIMKALPAAKSYAIKDAAENIGKLFGRDLNRKDTWGFTPAYATDENKEKIEKQRKEVKAKLEGKQ